MDCSLCQIFVGLWSIAIYVKFSLDCDQLQSMSNFRWIVINCSLCQIFVGLWSIAIYVKFSLKNDQTIQVWDSRHKMIKYQHSYDGLWSIAIYVKFSLDCDQLQSMSNFRWIVINCNLCQIFVKKWSNNSSLRFTS